MSLGPFVTVKTPSARKSLRIFTEVLDVKKKTDVLRVGAAEPKRKEIISGSVLWSSILNRKGYTKTNERVKKYCYH